MRITLCGSTKFPKAWALANRLLSLEGHAVYSIAFAGHAGDEDMTEDQKRKLDAVHMVKIANSEAILVLNVGGYVGHSTKQEIAFAESMGKEVYFLTLDGTTGPVDNVEPLFGDEIPPALLAIIEDGKE
jgi:hypothetical protein